MKTHSTHYKMKKLVALLTIFLLTFQSFSQEYLGRQTIIQFSPDHFVKPVRNTPQLKQSVEMSKATANPAFVGGVGGVSFDQVAVPAEGIIINHLQMTYNGEMENGKRLQLLINNGPIDVFIPDWMLVPIARYADSPFYSCVTLFGELENKQLEQVITEHEGRVINYHPALENTLLALRLLYMDMLIGYNFTHDLPRNTDQNYVLGLGELSPDTFKNRNGLAMLSQHLKKEINKSDQMFRSYVITDFSRKISFDLSKDSLVISGYPYYYCWMYKHDQEGYDVQGVADKLHEKYSVEKDSIRRIQGSQGVQEWLIGKMISLFYEYDGKYNFWAEGYFNEMKMVKSENAMKDFLSQFYPESLFSFIVETEAYMDRDAVVFLEELSNGFSSEPDLFEAANPEVWNTTVATMRFASFFRYVKSNYPTAWNGFIRQISEITPQPEVTTPHIMYNPDSKTVDQAIQKYVKN